MVACQRGGLRDHNRQMVIEDMVCAITTGREPAITLASVRPTLEWTLAMYRASDSGLFL